MAYGVDTWRVYSAEQSIDPGEPFSDIEEARALIRRVRRSAWARDRFDDVERVTVRLGGEERDGVTGSFSRRSKQFLATRHLISLHPSHLHPLVVLHELAHCYAPIWDGDVRQLRRDRVVYGRREEHDEMFTAALSLLVARFGTGENAADLADAYHHFGVPVASETDLLAARAHSKLVEVEAERMRLEAEESWRRQRDEMKQRRAAGEDVQEPWVPKFVWGSSLWRMRLTHYPTGRRRIGLGPLAKKVSAVEKCTPDDIKRIESMEEPPVDPADRRRAMAMVAALNIDPIWARTGLGLVRWTCGVELDELRLVNPGWVEHVQHLNDLLNSRPTYWTSDGTR